jgi:hypothetical protein
MIRVRAVVGAKAPKIARNFPKSIAALSATKADVSDRSQVNVAIRFALVAVPDPNQAIVW